MPEGRLTSIRQGPIRNRPESHPYRHHTEHRSCGVVGLHIGLRVAAARDSSEGQKKVPLGVAA